MSDQSHFGSLHNQSKSLIITVLNLVFGKEQEFSPFPKFSFNPLDVSETEVLKHLFIQILYHFCCETKSEVLITSQGEYI